MSANGAIFHSTAKATVLLIVRDGVIVESPPYAKRWALGRDARKVWQEGKRRGAWLEWMPDVASGRVADTDV